jgi:hypothetical protein
MPYVMRKVRGEDAYSVKNDETGKVHAKHTTRKLALAQLRLLNSLEGGALSSVEVAKFVKASYKPKSEAQTVGEYKLDKSLSSKKNKVYVDPAGKVVVANAGTSSISDWANNPSIAVGKYKDTKRYKQAERTQKKAIAKYGVENITNVAHSQSGETARILAKKGLTQSAVAVNPAIIGKKAGKNVDVVRSSGDLVSAFTRGKRKTIKAVSFNPLKEHSGNVLKRTDQMFGSGSSAQYVGSSSAQYIGGSFLDSNKSQVMSGYNIPRIEQPPAPQGDFLHPTNVFTSAYRPWF